MDVEKEYSKYHDKNQMQIGQNKDGTPYDVI